MKGIGFSIPDDVRDFAVFYCALQGTTPAAVAKKSFYAEMKRHPPSAAQTEEYEKVHGKVPAAFGGARPVRPKGN